MTILWAWPFLWSGGGVRWPRGHFLWPLLPNWFNFQAIGLPLGCSNRQLVSFSTSMSFVTIKWPFLGRKTHIYIWGKCKSAKTQLSSLHTWSHLHTQFDDTIEPVTFKMPYSPSGDIGTSRQSSLDVVLGNIGQVSHRCMTCMTTCIKNVLTLFLPCSKIGIHAHLFLYPDSAVTRIFHDSQSQPKKKQFYPCCCLIVTSHTYFVVATHRLQQKV